MFSRSHEVSQLHLGGIQAKRGDVIASENGIPGDFSRRKMRPFVSRYERSSEEMPATRLASIQS